MSYDVSRLKSRRLLLKDRETLFLDKYFEATVVEVSPSKERVKIEFTTGVRSWFTVDEFDKKYEVAEILKGRKFL